MDTKVCSKCKILKNISDFGPRPERPSGFRSKCRDCGNQYQIARYAKDPAKARETNRNLGFQPKSRYSRFKKRCVYSGKEFNLSFEQWISLVVDKPCHYCDGPLELKGCGLDRKDNSIGYTVGNVVPCCKECNRLKGPTLTYSEMIAVSKALREMRSK